MRNYFYIVPCLKNRLLIEENHGASMRSARRPETTTTLQDEKQTVRKYPLKKKF